MKIFFVIMGSAVIVSGAVISAFMLIDRQFVLFQAWDIALVFAASLLISVIPFGLAVVLTRVEKVERVQKEDYNLLERKITNVEKAAKTFYEEAAKAPEAHTILLEEGEPPIEGGSLIATEQLLTTMRKHYGLDSPPPPIQPFHAAVAAATPEHKPESAPKSGYKGATLNKVIRTALFSLGIICLALSAYYLFLLVFQGQWHNVNVRIPQLIQFFGGIVFMALSRILKNQEKIIRLSLKRRNDIDNANAGLVDKKHEPGDAAGK